MRSWLNSPAVALVGFVASLISIAQCCLWAMRAVYRTAKDVNSPVHVWFALAALATVVAVSILSWPAIMAEAAKIGTSGVTLDVYPVTVNGTAAVGALVILVDALDGRRFSPLPCAVLVAGLAFATALYFVHSRLGWGRYAVAAAPALVISALPLLMLARARATRRTAE